MSDQEPKSNAPSAGGSAVVLVEKTVSSRHKSFRPTELSDQTPAELHHKRSRAPAVPSVTEEYKDLPENDEIREQKESELAMTSEKPKRRTSKKSSKRTTSPEPIAMVPIEVEVVQRADITPSATQPIPSALDPGSDITESKEIIDNDDSITEEIADLRNAESTHKEWDTASGSQKCVPEKQDAEDAIPIPLQKKISSEIINKIDNEIENKNKDPVIRESGGKIPFKMTLASGTFDEITSTKRLKKKEITWTHSTYLDKVQLQNFTTRSAALMLEQKASVGPCFKKTLPFGEPSGITICLPKKSVKSFNDTIKPSKSGGINITVSKRCLDSHVKLSSDYEMRMKTDRVIFPRNDTKLNLKIEEGKCANFLDNLKGKLENWRGRIKHVLHM